MREELDMTGETFLVRTMSDTVETDIQRVFTIANEILPRYGMQPLASSSLEKSPTGHLISFSFRTFSPRNTRRTTI